MNSFWIWGKIFVDGEVCWSGILRVWMNYTRSNVFENQLCDITDNAAHLNLSAENAAYFVV